MMACLRNQRKVKGLLRVRKYKDKRSKAEGERINTLTKYLPSTSTLTKYHTYGTLLIKRSNTIFYFITKSLGESDSSYDFGDHLKLFLEASS